jgi:peptide/nickel transport system substrate-binding protein
LTSLGADVNMEQPTYVAFSGGDHDMIDVERARSPFSGGAVGRLGRLATTSVVIVGAVLAVAACGSSGGGGSNKAVSSLGTIIYGTLPPVGKPASGGVLSMGQLADSTPTYIFPIVPGANTSTGTVSFVNELYMPLYGGPTGAEPKINSALSAANPPIFSDGNKTVTIPIKPGLKWSDGAPVVANDLVFTLDLLSAAIKESPANWGQFAPGELPTNITSITTSGKYDVILHLKQAYNPGFFLQNQLQVTNNLTPLPSTAWNIAAPNGPHLDYTNPANAKKIYDFLNKAGGSVATFGSNPLWKVVDGPFKLKSFSATNSSYVLVPNPSYGGSPKPMFDELDTNTYTSFTAELNAVKGGTLDVATGIDPSQLPQAPALRAQGIYIYGGPAWGWFGGIINFKDTANHFDKVIGQPYVRAAIAHMVDQPGIIRGVYKNAAVPAYGPTPSAPASPYAPADATTPAYPYDPAEGVALLKSHGWKVVPNGTTTCVKPGTASNECGAGIPAGTPISFTWANRPESQSSTGALESEALSSVAKQAAGINITLTSKTFNFLTSNYNDQNPAAAKYTNDWGVNNFGGLFMDYYPTMDQVFNKGGGFNTGAFEDPHLDGLIHNSKFGSNPDAVKTEASYTAKAVPVFFMPDYDYLLAVNTKKVAGPADGWTVLTQQQWYPQYWYQVK